MGLLMKEEEDIAWIIKNYPNSIFSCTREVNLMGYKHEKSSNSML